MSDPRPEPDPAGETVDESGGTMDEAAAPLKPVGPEDEADAAEAG